MSRFVNGKVEISAPFEVVSVALGGMLEKNHENRASKFKLDKAEMKKYKKTEEGKCLKPFLISASSMELEIKRASDSETILEYNLGKKSWFTPSFVVLIIESIILACLGALIESMSMFAYFSWIIYGIAAFLAVYAVILQLILRAKLEKKFHKIFFPRLDRYVDIVKNHKNAGTGNGR